MMRSRASVEALDDDHAAAAVGAGMFWCLRFVGIGIGSFDRIDGKYGKREQLAGAGDVLGTFAAGEQAVVADAVEACGQHVDEKAADELACGERHHLVTLSCAPPFGLAMLDTRPKADTDHGETLHCSERVCGSFRGYFQDCACSTHKAGEPV
jgi:hypothetical protein